MEPLFEGLYAKVGRPSIPPERLLRALLLQIPFTVRSERQLMEDVFGCMKTVGLRPTTRHRGQPKPSRVFTLTTAAYDPIRTRNPCALRTPAKRSVTRSGGWRVAAD